MKTIEYSLKEFHNIMDTVKKPFPSRRKKFKRGWHNIENKGLMTLRESLFLEELKEFGIAYDTKDKQNMLKEACDIVYVLVGWLVELGLPFNKAFAIVHENNMTKFPDGAITQREDGKILKPDSYVPVDLDELCPKGN